MTHSRKALSLAVVLAFVLSVGCIGPDDLPSHVHDLRVLGLALEPPEVMAPSCAQTVSNALLLATQLRFDALLADPQGGGRALDYELYACASTTDRTCATEEDRVLLAQGTTPPGVLTLQLRPGIALTPAGRPLLERVAEEDTFRGLGGLRVPLVLHLRAGDEEVYAQKLMVYNCALFPEMVQNVTPRLPALTVNGEVWADGDVPVFGAGPVRIEPQDFSASEEDYVVPSFDLTPVALKESWKVAWFADGGRLSVNETGGTDFGGQEARHRVEWFSRSGQTAGDLTFWAVVRDGRGGLSWLVRRARFEP
jgi:hypothetical protein